MRPTSLVRRLRAADHAGRFKITGVSGLVRFRSGDWVYDMRPVTGCENWLLNAATLLWRHDVRAKV